MGLKNFSTKVDVHVTLGEIQGRLASAGARSITIDYSETGEPNAVVFELRVPTGKHVFRLPMRADAVEVVLGLQYANGQIDRRFASREQATRVGWRIIKDWIDAQIAIIETEMVSLPEVMLPFLIDGDGVTMFAAFTKQQLALAPAKAAK